MFSENTSRISISGVQQKFSVILQKNKLRLTNAGEHGQYILKPIPLVGNNAAQMPANEHLTMQIASQVYGIETAENALIFFRDGSPAYITKRFDVRADGTKWAQDDFASLAGRTPQTHGPHYKYKGNYLEIFGLMKQYLPAYKLEAPKLFKLLLFNYLFSNGDAHFKNFSIIETPLGDFRLSPAYDLLNSKIHVSDTNFALEDGLLPKPLAKGKMMEQFYVLGNEMGIPKVQLDRITALLLSKTDKAKALIDASFLKPSLKRNYWQAYQGKLKQLEK
jgi:serine/threonine-protein kinase HipA